MFVEMLLGDPPFQGETPAEVFQNILNWETILPQLLSQYALYTTANCFELISGYNSFHFVNIFVSFLCIAFSYF